MITSLDADKSHALHVFCFLQAGVGSSDPIALERFRTACDLALNARGDLARHRESASIQMSHYAYRTDTLQEIWIKRDGVNGQCRRISELLGKNPVPDLTSWPCAEELYTEDCVLVKPQTTRRHINVVALIKRRKELSLERFHEYWINVHGPLVMELPHIDNYVQCRTIDEAYPFGEPHWDGIARLGAPDLDRYKQMLASPGFLQRARPHADKFLERGSRHVGSGDLSPVPSRSGQTIVNSRIATPNAVDHTLQFLRITRG